MLVREVVASHQAFQSRSRLRKNLGDGFLYAHNPVFRGIRDEVSARGYRFTPDDFCGYQAMSLIALGPILKTKKIPVLDNVSPLIRIERACPGRFDFDEIPSLAKNFLMHESAHCVADSIFARKSFEPLKISADRKILLRSLLCESVANTADLLAMAATGPGVHAALFEMNSYFSVTEQSSRVARLAVEILGPVAAAQLGIISYLHSNFLLRDLDRAQLEAALGCLAIDKRLNSEEQLALLSFFQYGSNLDGPFRVSTAPFYFAFATKSRADYYGLLEFDFMKVLAGSPAILEGLRELGGVLANA